AGDSLRYQAVEHSQLEFLGVGRRRRGAAARSERAADARRRDGGALAGPLADVRVGGCTRAGGGPHGMLTHVRRRVVGTTCEKAGHADRRAPDRAHVRPRESTARFERDPTGGRAERLAVTHLPRVDDAVATKARDRGARRARGGGGCTARAAARIATARRAGRTALRAGRGLADGAPGRSPPMTDAARDTARAAAGRPRPASPDVCHA